MSAIQEEEAIPDLTLGWRLQMALRHADLTALDMSREMEVGRDTIARWLHDETVPHRLFLQAWAVRCHVNYEWLVGEEAPKSGRGTRVGAGRRAFTDNNDYVDKPERVRRTRRPTKATKSRSYRYCHATRGGSWRPSLISVNS